jgi:hypothetical protein
MRDTIILKLFIFVLLILTCSFSSLALVISPGSLTIDYVPGSTHTQNFLISQGSTNVIIAVGGTLPEEYTLSEDYLDLTDGEPHIVTVTFNLANLDNNPGKHALWLSATEDIPGEALVSKASVNAKVQTYVGYPYKYAEITGVDYTYTSEIGTGINFRLDFMNLGNEIIDNVEGEIQLFDLEENLILSLPTTGYTDLHPSGEIQLSNNDIISDITSGVHQLKAIINYDENTTESSLYRIIFGSRDLDVINVTPTEIPVDIIYPLEVILKNHWNENVEFYLSLLVKDSEGNEVKSFMSSPTSINNQAEGSAIAYFDTNGLSIGDYVLEITVVYEGLQEIVEFPITLIENDGTIDVVIEEPIEVVPSNESSKENGNNLTIPIVIITAMALIILLLVVFIKKRKDSKNQKEGDFGENDSF